MTESKLKRVVMALKVLNRNKNLLDILATLGISSEDFPELLENKLPDSQVPILLLDSLGHKTSRVFSVWEQAFLTNDAREFLLVALHTKAITQSELEQTLAFLFTQLHATADVEEIREILANVVQDPSRTAVLALSHQDYIH